MQICRKELACNQSLRLSMLTDNTLEEYVCSFSSINMSGCGNEAHEFGETIATTAMQS